MCLDIGSYSDMMRSGGGWNYNNRGQPSMFGGQDDWYPTDRYATKHAPCNKIL